MRMLGLLGTLAVATLPTLAHAQEYVWHVYHGDDPAASLVVIDKTEIDEPEAYWLFAMQCSFDEEWRMSVAGIDAKALGGAIAAGEQVEFAFVVDGELGGRGLGGYFPELSFSQMTGEWEYSVPFDLDTIYDLGVAKRLAIKGTGIDLALPPEGRAAFAKFGSICKALRQTGEDGGG